MAVDERHREEDRQYARAMRWGLGLSVLVHVLLFIIFSARPIPRSPFSAAGERAGDERAAAGGGMEAVELRTPTQDVPAPPEVEPVPTEEVEEVEPPDPEVTLEEIPAIAMADAVMRTGTEGPAEGPGRVEGTGRGDGGTEAEGLFRVIPPRPRGLILPPSERPDRVRGKEVEVWVYVTAKGEVVPDSTRLNPSTGDRRFDRRLRDYAAGWAFEAARRDGRAVAEWFRYTLSM
jgi:outer membrane biosynthesis protein TonB